MTENDLSRIEQLFQAAADLASEDRSAYLDEACTDDPALRAHVERLLDRLDHDLSLASPVTAPIEHLATALTEGPGAIIGRYKLLQVIGEGGFGVVYMSEQQDPVIRKVALKIIKLGMDTREVIARFEAERQALALMDHPNIAKVLDGGATNSGRPYFVMELVRGVPITEYCDKNELTTSQRLSLFLKTCHAVQHAHQKGVIHRDIKPSNVLVTLHDGEPMPKIIDFGVAKAMHTRLTEKTLFTRYEQFVGTPAYMSPEQAEMSALDVDTRTDIYSLGVLLYELLTGTTPFDTTSMREAGLVEIQRIIREEHPPRPSLRISTAASVDVARHRGVDIAGLSRTLRGDLDWVVMRALEKDRSRRYASASEFAEDVQRYLRDEPVAAGAPGAGYRIRKFLSRNRAAVVTAGLVAVALIGGIIATTAAMLESSRNAQLATQHAARVTRTLDFMLSTLSLTNPEVALNPEVTVQTLLDHTSGRVAASFAEDPWSEVRVRDTLGGAYMNLGQYPQAEHHLRRIVELVSTYGTIDGTLQLGEDTGGYDALDFHNTLWALTNVCFELERGDSFNVATRARTVGLACLREAHPHLAAALASFAQAVEQGAWSVDTSAMDGVQEMFAALTTTADTTLPEGDPMWSILINSLMAAGYTVWYTPHEAIASEFWNAALTIQRRELPPDHPDIAATVTLLAGIWNRQGRLADSEALLRESIAALRRVHRAGALSVAQGESMLGETLMLQGRFDEAEPVLLASHEDTLVALGDPSHWRVLESYMRIISLYDNWKQPDKSEPYREALVRTCALAKYTPQWIHLQHTFTTDSQSLVDLAVRIQSICTSVSLLATPGTITSPELAPLIKDFVEEVARCDVTELRTVAVARLLLGWANALDPEDHEAERYVLAAQACDILHHWETELALDLADGQALLAQIELSRGHFDIASQLGRDAWNNIRSTSAIELWYLASTTVRVARTLLDLEMFEAAETLLRRAYERLRAQLGDHHVETILARSLLHDAYLGLGRLKDAALYAPSRADPPTVQSK